MSSYFFKIYEFALYLLKKEWIHNSSCAGNNCELIIFTMRAYTLRLFSSFISRHCYSQFRLWRNRGWCRQQATNRQNGTVEENGSLGINLFLALPLLIPVMWSKQFPWCFICVFYTLRKRTLRHAILSWTPLGKKRMVLKLTKVIKSQLWTRSSLRSSLKDWWPLPLSASTITGPSPLLQSTGSQMGIHCRRRCIVSFYIDVDWHAT